MQVYRIEKKCLCEWHKGEGPYADGNLRALEAEHSVGTTHPCFWEDGIVDDPKFSERTFIAGFETKKDMKDWFKGWGKRLRESGLIVGVYDVDADRVIFGKSKLQLAFDKEVSKKIRNEPITFQ